MNIVTLTPGRIGVMEVDENHRAVVLKRHFDRRDLKIESDIYALMRRIAPDYRHSDWRVFETTNEGVFMAPLTVPLTIQVERTVYRGELSSGAAGIVVTLLVLREAAMLYHDDDLFTKFLRLRDFASQHDEGRHILAATD